MKREKLGINKLKNLKNGNQSIRNSNHKSLSHDEKQVGQQNVKTL